jgi:hypothetical protein
MIMAQCHTLSILTVAEEKGFMLLQSNSYVVPKEKRTEHARLVRRFRQTLNRLGCDQFDVFEQVGPNWSSGESTGRFVQMMRFRDRKHQLAVQSAERQDPTAQQLIADFCELINFPYQQQQGLFAVGFYQSALPVAPQRPPGVDRVEEAPEGEESLSEESFSAAGEPVGDETESTEPEPGLHTVDSEFETESEPQSEADAEIEAEHETSEDEAAQSDHPATHGAIQDLGDEELDLQAIDEPCGLQSVDDPSDVLMEEEPESRLGQEEPAQASRNGDQPHHDPHRG